MTIFIEYENEILAYKSFEDWLSYHSIEDKIPHDLVCMWDAPVVMYTGIAVRERISRETMQEWLDEINQNANEAREHYRMERNRGVV